MTDLASAPELRLQSSGNETRRILGIAGMVGHFLLIKALELERASFCRHSEPDSAIE
jgi:hypothetical protein